MQTVCAYTVLHVKALSLKLALAAIQQRELCMHGKQLYICHLSRLATELQRNGEEPQHASAIINAQCTLLHCSLICVCILAWLNIS